MPTFGTLLPNGDGTINTSVITRSSGTSDYNTYVAQDPTTGQPDSGYLYNAGSAGGNGYFEFTDMPTDFVSVTTLNVRTHTVVVGRVDDNIDLRVAIYDSTETTLYAGDSGGTQGAQVGGAQNPAGLKTTALTISAAGLAATKAQWSAARIRINWVYSQVMSKDSYDLRLHALDLTGTYSDVSPTADTVGFRFRTGDTVGLNVDSDWAAAQNTNVSLATADLAFRLRFEVNVTGATTLPACQLQYRYASDGSTFGSWTNMPNNSQPFLAGSVDGQRLVQAIPSDQFVDLDATTNLLTAGTGTFNAGDGSEDSLTGTATGTSPWHTEHEFCILARKLSQFGHMPDGAAFQFRLVSGLATDTYTVTPQLTIANRSGHIGGSGVETPHRNLVETDESVLYTIVEPSDLTTAFDTYLNEGFMMKSSDAGVSWAPVDIAGQTERDMEAIDLIYEASTDTIHVILEGTTGDACLSRRFYTSGHATLADTWDDTDGWQTIRDPLSNSVGQHVSLNLRSDGSIVGTFSDANGGTAAADRSSWYAIRSTGGTWGTPAAIPQTTLKPLGGGFAIIDNIGTGDRDDAVHIFYIGQTSGIVYHRCLTGPAHGTANTLSDRSQVATGLATNTVFANMLAPPVVWSDGGTLKVGVLFGRVVTNNSPDRSGFSLHFAWSAIPTNPYWTGTDPYSWTIEAVTDAGVEAVGNGIGSRTIAGGIVVDGSDIIVTFANYTTGFIMTDTRTSGAWGTNTNEITDTYYRLARPHRIAGGIGLKTDSSPSGGTGTNRYHLISLSTTLNITPTGATVAVTPGGLTVFEDQPVTPTGASVAVAPGTLTVFEDQPITPAGATVTVTAGALSLDLAVAPVGVTVTVTPGTPTLDLSIAPVGAAVTVTAGTVTIAEDQPITPAGATVSVAAGTVSVVEAQPVTPAGAAVTVTPGTLTVVEDQPITPAGASVAVAPGTLTVFEDQPITPVGAAVAATPGTATVFEDQPITPDGATVTITPGTPSLDLAIGPVGATVTATPGTATLDLAIAVTGAAVTVTPGTLSLLEEQPISPTGATVAATPGTLALASAVTPTAPTVTVTAGTLTVVEDQPVAPAGAAVTVTAGTLAVGPAVLLDAPTVTATPGALTVFEDQPVSLTGGSVAVTPGTLAVATTVTPVGATVAVTPGALDVVEDQPVTPTGASVAVTPGALTLDLAVELDAAAVTVTPGAVTVVADQAITPVGATVAVTPGSATIVSGLAVAPDAATVTATPGSVSLDLNIAPTGAAVSVAPGAVSVAVEQQVSPDGGTVTVTAGSVSLTQGQPISPTGPTISVAPGTPTLDLAIAVAGALVGVTPGTPSINAVQAVLPVGATVNVGPGTPAVDLTVTLNGATVNVTPGSLAFITDLFITPTGALVSVTAGSVVVDGGVIVTIASMTVTLSAPPIAVSVDPPDLDVVMV